MSEQLREHLLTRILGNAGELRRMIDQLLDIAALGRGHELSPVPAHVDLRDVVDAVVEELAFHIGGRPRTRVVDRVWVSADRDLLARTLVNLLSNACKYSDPGTPVSLEARRERDHVRVAVREAGPGVAPEDRSRVFEPFWRGRVAVAQAIRGTGIGLALVNEYVTAMGGTAGVESPPEGGAVFWFTVPASSVGVGGGHELATTLEDAHTDPEDG